VAFGAALGCATRRFNSMILDCADSLAQVSLLWTCVANIFQNAFSTIKSSDAVLLSSFRSAK
jgi:hypothetical protein